jgi:cyclohexanecarboxylate-CoA ligase
LSGRWSVAASVAALGAEGARGGVPGFWELVERRADLTPDAPCLVDEHERRLTFGEYRSSCASVAAGLAAQGIGPGTVVAWQLPTWIDTIVLCGALARLGAVQVPVLPPYRQREMRLVLEQTRPEVLFVPERWQGRAYAEEHAALAASVGARLVVVDGGLAAGDPSGLPAYPPAPPGDGPESTRWIYYTSGTTTAPKGARHTDAHLVVAAEALVECLRLTPDDRGTIVFPFAHIGGAFLFLSGILGGHPHVVVSRFGAEVVPLLAREGVTYAGSGLSFQRTYLEVQREQPGRSIFPRIRGFPHGGDARRPHVHEALKREVGGAGVLSNYGMTEVPMIASGAVDDPPGKLAERIGRPCPTMEVRIVAPDGSPGAPGTEGEIRVRGATVLSGYVDASLDDGAFDEEGFFRTGDIGFVDGDGYLEVTGRLKDVIIRKGENISAVEVEDLLHRHPAVAEVAVVGLPDEERGERCCAVVVLADGAGGLDLASVVAFLVGEGLMIQKCPEQLEVRASLPRDFFGKVNKALLRRELG